MAQGTWILERCANDYFEEIILADSPHPGPVASGQLLDSLI